MKPRSNESKDLSGPELIEILRRNPGVEETIRVYEGIRKEQSFYGILQNRAGRRVVFSTTDSAQV